jgi:hypothetical protein
METLDQKKFDSMLRLLQAANPLKAANPKIWGELLHNVGVTASAAPPPAELERIMERVFWMVRQAGIKDPAAWMVFDMARAEAASASVQPDALRVAVAPNRVELGPVKLGTNLAKTFGASPMASQRRIQNPAVSIATATARVTAPLASVGPEARPKIAPPVAVRQNPVEPKPVKLGTDQTRSSRASPVASEARTENPGARIATDVARVTAPLGSVEPKARPKVARPVAVRQNPVEPTPVKLRTDRAKMLDLSLLELETASEFAAQELNWAKLSLKAGKRREAADHIYNAHDLYYATQQEIAVALGKSQGWVSCMIRWRRERFKDDTPFGPASKDARFAARVGRLMPQKPARGLVRLWMRRRLAPTRVAAATKDDAHASVSSGVLVIGVSQSECPPVADIKGSENKASDRPTGRAE